MMKYLSLLLLMLSTVLADQLATEDVVKQGLNISAIFMFLLFVAGTIVITIWASRQTKSANDFYTAGGDISGFKNGNYIERTLID